MAAPKNPLEARRKKSEAAAKSPKAIKEIRSKFTEEENEAVNAKQRKPNLKPSQWAEMEALWESGEVTLRELADRFGRDASLISRHMTQNNVIQGSRAEEYARLIKEKIAAELAFDPGESARKIKQIKEDGLKYTDMINKLTFNEFVSAKKATLPLQSIYNNLKAIKEAMAIFSMTRAENWVLLGVIDFEQKYQESEIPELLISELTTQDVEEMRMEQIKTASLTGEASPDDLEDLIANKKGISEIDEQ